MYFCRKNFCKYKDYQTNECMATWHGCEYRIMMDYRNKTR